MTLFPLFILISIALVAAQLDTVQHAALMEIYNATGCSTTFCPRFAANELCPVGTPLVCNGTNIVELNMADCFLTGTISSVVGQLTALTFLMMGFNELVGTIPSAMGQMTALIRLTLYYNGLVGTIPSALGQLTALQNLFLNDNAGLVGTIPSTFSQLTKLQQMYLSNTRLNGTIPPTTAPLIGGCDFRSTLLDCTSKPRASCLCTPRLPGDDCENRLPISDGATIVSTVTATPCFGCSSCAISIDVWREWTASCTGNATISACGFASTKTALGIYRRACPSTSTPTATTEPDSDDCDDFGSCGGSGHEEAVLAVAVGESIIIRLGSVDGSTVNGTLSISCLTITTAATTTTTAAAATAVAVPTTQAVSRSVMATTPTTAAATTAVIVAGSMTQAGTAMPTAMPTVVGTTANASTTAAPPANASISAAATPSSGTDVALIAGAAGGGAAALLLLTGLVVFFVCRARKAKAGNNGRTPAGGDELHQSNYAALVLKPNEYDVCDVTQVPASNEYGRFNATEPQYADGMLQAGDGIQVKQTGVGTEYSAL